MNKKKKSFFFKIILNKVADLSVFEGSEPGLSLDGQWSFLIHQIFIWPETHSRPHHNLETCLNAIASDQNKSKHMRELT